jgi:hypothetical protein
MDKLPKKLAVKKRPYKPQEVFNTKFASAIYDISGKFIKTSAFKHSLTKGEEREDPLIDFFQENLPNTYSVVKGEIVDKFNNSSQQLDLMIYDNSRNIPFISGNHYILPAEALLASVEIKSRLTKDETKKILKSTNTLKTLKPFGQLIDENNRGRSVDDKIICRYFHSVFAYETDFSVDDWSKKEFERLVSVSTEENIDFGMIDRIFVLGRGIINPLDNTGKSCSDDAENLLYFYMSILNFIQRENNRRRSVPYLDYAGQLSNGWEKLV